MSTQRETVNFILEKLKYSGSFSTKSMFGEYALYANGKVVGFICDDMLFIKIMPASSGLEDLCEKGHAYPGSKLYYIVEETQLSTIENLAKILMKVADSIPTKVKKS